MRVAALCAGYGGLEIAAADIWPGTETVWVAETDRHASTVLAARFAAPNLGDLTAITDPPPADIVTAGFPCQPVSTAGLRKGIDDDRWIIDDVCRVAAAAGAHTLILENVTGLLTASSGDAMARVCAAMALHGFSRWKWTTVRASDIGACHRRNRWFCVADTDDVGRQRSGDARRRRPRPAHDSAATADTDSERRTQFGIPKREEPRSDLCEAAGRGRFGTYWPAVARWELALGRPAPPPLDVDHMLNARFVEFMMGLPDGWVTDIIESRPKALHILGNGVVPQQAAHAIRQLTA